MKDPVLYLYGVMDEGAPELAVQGIEGTAVRPLRCEGFTALVSWVDPRAAELQVEAVMAHNQVLAAAMQAGTVIAVAFGHLFDSEAKLCAVLETAATDICANLERIRGCVEVGVKAAWLKDALLSDIETPELQALTEQARRPGADPALVVAAGELVEQLIEQRRDQYIREICEPIGKAAIDMVINDPLMPRMVFNAAFLIPADAQDSFLRHLEQVAKPYDGRLEFQYSGPWPPHNFSQLRIAQ